MKKLLLIIGLAALGACGVERETIIEKEVPAEPGTVSPKIPGAVSDKPSYAEVRPIYERTCLRCHPDTSFMRDEKGLRNAAEVVRNQLINKDMPPNKSELNERDRAFLVRFF